VKPQKKKWNTGTFMALAVITIKHGWSRFAQYTLGDWQPASILTTPSPPPANP